MAKANYCDGAPVRNTFSPSSPSIHPLHPQIVVAPAISPEVQVKLLALVDEAAGVALGDCMAALPDIDAVGAVLAMVEHRMLAFDTSAPFDQHLQIRRVPRPATEPDGALAKIDALPEGEDEGKPNPFELQLRTLAPQIFAVAGADRRQIANIAELTRPGAYFLIWYDGQQPRVYVGYGKNVQSRLLTGQHMHRPMVPDLIVGIVEQENQLTKPEAKVLERLLYQSLDHARDVQLANDDVPDGDAVDPGSYALLRQLVTQIIFSLRDNGILFLAGTARHHAAGARAGRGQLGPLRAGLAPEGQLHELSAVGIKAYACRHDEDWTVLAGSEVRRKAVPSADSTATLLRGEYLYSGILVEEGVNLRLTRDLVFDSGSGAAHFVTGAKGHGLAAWNEVESIPDELLALFPKGIKGPSA